MTFSFAFQGRYLVSFFSLRFHIYHGEPVLYLIEFHIFLLVLESSVGLVLISKYRWVRTKRGSDSFNFFSPLIFRPIWRFSENSSRFEIVICLVFDFNPSSSISHRTDFQHQIVISIFSFGGEEGRNIAYRAIIKTRRSISQSDSSRYTSITAETKIGISNQLDACYRLSKVISFWHYDERERSPRDGEFGFSNSYPFRGIVYKALKYFLFVFPSMKNYGKAAIIKFKSCRILANSFEHAWKNDSTSLGNAVANLISTCVMAIRRI